MLLDETNNMILRAYWSTLKSDKYTRIKWMKLRISQINPCVYVRFMYRGNIETSKEQFDTRFTTNNQSSYELVTRRYSRFFLRHKRNGTLVAKRKSRWKKGWRILMIARFFSYISQNSPPTDFWYKNYRRMSPSSACHHECSLNYRSV